MSIEQHVLPNGLTLLGEPKASAQSIAAGFFVRTGARDETSEIAGVSHFLEHMMFKGSNRRSAEQVNLEFDEIGANYNAFTSEENTVYYGAVLPEFQPRLLDLLCDMMRPSLRAEDFDMEKNVILEEIALYQDRPQQTVFDILRRVHFGEHPLANSVLGTTESISALRQEQMKAYFDRRYSPENMALTLVGAYDWDSAVSQAEKLCGGWTPHRAERILAPYTPQQCAHVATDSRVNRAHVAIAAPGVSAQDPEFLAADTVAAVLGGPRGSRLYWALIEPGLADVAQLFHSAEDGAGWFGGYFSCDPARAEEVRDRFSGVLEEAMSGDIRPEEVARVTRKDAAGHVIHGETPMGRLTSVGFDWMYRHHIRSVDEEADEILSITADRCNALLSRRPFSRTTTVALGPLRARIEPVTASG